MKKRIVLSLLSLVFMVTGCNPQPPSEPLVTSPDLEAPKVNFLNLSNNEEIGGVRRIEIKATDNLQVYTVDLVCGGETLSAEKTKKDTYEVLWDTSSLADGTYTVTAKATDLYKNVGEHNLSIKINNSFTLLNYNNEVFRGLLIFKAKIAQFGADDKVEFHVDGEKKADGSLDIETGDYTGVWGGAENGEYNIKAVLKRDGGEELETAVVKVKVEKVASNLTEVGGFGTNPGNLRMWLYSPASVNPNPGLVIALHGCSQNAASYAFDTGWNIKAEVTNNFHVVYPEQKTANNLQLCFNWFTKIFQQRDYKETKSIAQMIDYMVTNHGVDSNKVYITGFSAGACMSSVMLATYPDKFSGASLIAGIGYGEAVDVASAGLLMLNGKGTNTPSKWGDLFKEGYSDYSGSYNHKVIIFQGAVDAIVVAQNAIDLVKAWGNLKGKYNTDAEYVAFNSSSCGSGTDYTCTQFDTNLQYYLFSDIGHALPTDVQLVADLSGYAAKATIHSTDKAYDFWGF